MADFGRFGVSAAPEPCWRRGVGRATRSGGAPLRNRPPHPFLSCGLSRIQPPEALGPSCCSPYRRGVSVGTAQHAGRQGMPLIGRRSQLRTPRRRLRKARVRRRFAPGLRGSYPNKCRVLLARPALAADCRSSLSPRRALLRERSHAPHQAGRSGADRGPACAGLADGGAARLLVREAALRTQARPCGHNAT